MASMEADRSNVWKRGYVTLMTLFVGVFLTFLTDKVVYQEQDKKGGNCERIYT